MCVSNYSAENTPHSSGPLLAVELSICGRWKRRATGKGNSLLDSGGQIAVFEPKLLLLWVKLESVVGWNRFRFDEGALGRAKKKHSGFCTVPSSIPCHKLHSLNFLVGVFAILVLLISGIIN